MPPSCGRSASIRNVEGGVAEVSNRKWLGIKQATKIWQFWQMDGHFCKISLVICALFGLVFNDPCQLGACFFLMDLSIGWGAASEMWWVFSQQKQGKTKPPPGDSIRDTWSPIIFWSRKSGKLRTSLGHIEWPSEVQVTKRNCQGESKTFLYFGFST